MSLRDCRICFAPVDVLSLKYHSVYVPPGGQYDSPDASLVFAAVEMTDWFSAQQFILNCL